MHLSSPALRLPAAVVATQPFIGLAPDGSLLSRDGDALQVGDARIAVPAGVAAAAMVGGQAWVVTGDGMLRRFALTGKELGSVAIGALAGDLAIASAVRAPRAMLIEGDRAGVVIREGQGGTCAVEALGARHADRRILVGTRVAERRGAHIRLGQSELAIPADLVSAHVGASAVVLDGSSLLVELIGARSSTILLYSLRNLKVTARIRICESRVMAVADRAGIVVIARETHVALLDLRVGRCTAERILTSSVAACAIDELGANIAIVDGNGNAIRLGRALNDVDGAASDVTGTIVAVDADDASVAHATTTAVDLATTASNVTTVNTASNAAATTATAANVAAVTTATASNVTAIATTITVDAANPASNVAAVTTATASNVVVASTGEPVTDAADAAVANDTGAVAAADELGNLYLHALGAPRAEVLAPAELADYLATVHAWVAQACAAVVAERRGETTARDAYRTAAARLSAWHRRGAPHVEIAHELGLSPMAATVMLLVAAPQIWCDLARAYAMATADGSRPLVDELLVATLLEAGIDDQSALASELDGDAPLVRAGAVIVAAGERPHAALSVHASIARRLAGATLAPARTPATRWTIELADLVGPRAAVAALAHALEEPRPAPVRIALRGKSGAGRRTVAALLAAHAGREVDLASLQGDLASQLRDIVLRGHVPMVDLDGLPADDDARRAAVRTAIDTHTGPLFVRAQAETDLPFAPTDTVVFPMLDEAERAACWRSHTGDAAQADALAARYAIGPGAIARAAASADPIAALRASRGQRISRLAERVERLATWDSLVVTDDVGDAMRELVARVLFRRTVLETWGMGQVATTARGVTALFQGGPGTGKTMAAGVIAGELGYELWRVDLSKVVSKWIGETERNLAQLFDAAEEGEIVLLFDEADALFTKRTEVKSSNDKHANAATNYLLQRIDSFTGIAILTTNFGTAIDSAFRRRLAVQVEFPFPDEDERLRLWRAHLPRALPTAGDLRLPELAATYELSGGYIRNAALRAAFLAAGRSSSQAITADDLRRAISLEKERVGKLGNGRIE